MAERFDLESDAKNKFAERMGFSAELGKYLFNLGKWHEVSEEARNLTNITESIAIEVNSGAPKNGIYNIAVENKVVLGTDVIKYDISYETRLYVLLHEFKHIEQFGNDNIVKILFSKIFRGKKYEMEANKFAYEKLSKKYGKDKSEEIFNRAMKELYKYDINDFRKILNEVLKEADVDSINKVKFKFEHT